MEYLMEQVLQKYGMAYITYKVKTDKNVELEIVHPITPDIELEIVQRVEKGKDALAYLCVVSTANIYIYLSTQYYLQ